VDNTHDYARVLVYPTVDSGLTITYCILVYLTEKLKPGLDTEINATGYPVPKMGNVANH